MKKFYCNGKIVYMHNDHNSCSAKIILKELGIASEFDNVCQALDGDQDMLGVCGPEFEEAAVSVEVPDYKFPEQDAATVDTLSEFFVDMLGDEDYDHYVLPNGKSAPYGLTGVEVAALKEDDTIYVVDLLFSEGIRKYQKIMLSADAQLVATDRDLVFSNRSKAVQAYNALFGDLYGEI